MGASADGVQSIGSAGAARRYRKPVASRADHAGFEQAEFPPDGKADALRHAVLAGVPRLRCFVIEAAIRWQVTPPAPGIFFTRRATEYLHMDCLYIDPAYRDAGLGAEMMRLMARHARALDCATLQWQTPAWNTGAARFYERLGARSCNKLRSVGFRNHAPCKTREADSTDLRIALGSNPVNPNSRPGGVARKA